jgi:hypothetical protein
VKVKLQPKLYLVSALLTSYTAIKHCSNAYVLYVNIIILIQFCVVLHRTAMRGPGQSTLSLSDHDHDKMQSGPDNKRLLLDDATSESMDDHGVNLPPISAFRGPVDVRMH